MKKEKFSISNILINDIHDIKYMSHILSYLSQIYHFTWWIYSVNYKILLDIYIVSNILSHLTGK